MKLITQIKEKKPQNVLILKENEDPSIWRKCQQAFHQ